MLSRYPVSDPQAKEMLAECDSDNEQGVSFAELRALSSSPQESVRLQGLRTHAQDDHTDQKLPDSCNAFWGVRSLLSVDDGLIVYGCRPLILTKMRRQILSELHDSHQGSVWTKERAKQIVYWPGVDNDYRHHGIFLQGVSRSPTVAAARAYCAETQARPPIPGNCCRLLFLRWLGFPHLSRLLHCDPPSA